MAQTGGVQTIINVMVGIEVGVRELVMVGGTVGVGVRDLVDEEVKVRLTVGVLKMPPSLWLDKRMDIPMTIIRIATTPKTNLGFIRFS
jgi:hypothetical protein